jgi:lycopene elongase/hydratase (dihydrobisanhydrobacterioruberin-forming)
MSHAVQLALKLTRPRFWPYVLGPFAIGVLSAQNSIMPWLLIILWGLFWTYPANYIIYGANDVFDYETDKRNPKKQTYELLIKPAQQKAILLQVAGWSFVGWLLAAFTTNPAVMVAYLLFLLFGIDYSAPPIRAKAQPFVDAFFNILYVFPGIIGYILVSGSLPSLQLVAAATLWCMAMHAFSAVPDINADAKAGIRTVATKLGSADTILFCALCYVLAAGLSAAWLGLFSLFGAVVYGYLMAAAYRRANRREAVFKIYTIFPLVNLLMGAALFWYISLFVV